MRLALSGVRSGGAGRGWRSQSIGPRFESWPAHFDRCRVHLVTTIALIVLAVMFALALHSASLALITGVAGAVVMAGGVATHIRVRDEAKEYVPFVIVTVAAVVLLVTL